MNILEQINLARNSPRDAVKVTTLRDLKIGEAFRFGASQSMRVGEMIYICRPRNHAYGRAIITNEPTPGEYEAKRTS